MVSEVHLKLLIKALNILKNDHQEIYQFYKNNKELIKGSTIPDYDEGYVGTHYYIYKDKKSYYKNRLGKYMRSARTSFLEHYTMAINQFMNGMIEIAFNSLGRAIHYLTDMGTPPHTSNVSDANLILSIILKPHSKFEYYVRANLEKFYIDKCNKYEYFTNESFDTIMHDVVKASSVFKRDLLKRRNYEEISKICIPLILEIITGLLYRFFWEINNKPFYLITNHPYPFGKIALVEDGTYEIEGQKGYWRFIRDNGKYILVSSIHNFKKVLTTNGKIMNFNPNRVDMYWLIEETENYHQPNI